MANGPEKGGAKKFLIAFDFDDTIIAANSDLYVCKLAPEGKIPKRIKDLYSKHGWTRYMAAIFTYLHENGTVPDDIIRCMKEIEFINGMKGLFHFLVDNNFDVIIISDSNSVFIDCILSSAGVAPLIQKVYTNPAAFDESGQLQLQCYHIQDWCDLSTVNLCKGHILKEHVEKQRENGVEYDVVCYVGDGTNDVCPCLKLRSHDIAFPRMGYKLMNELDMRSGEVIAKVIPWQSGSDIMAALQTEVLTV
ncbi:Pyridoxal phosphate phosphatase PHOSPHO2 [Lamellibrachia satsuma]|nr:Pyridoxal phosphate phosphatase PHOSPHO2 [Lamellibrachia satsuma]